MSNNATKVKNPMKVITGPDTRWSYANVWEPKSINGGTPKYSVSLIIPKSDTKTVAKIKAAIEAAYQEGTLESCLIPLDAPIQHLPAVYLTEEARHAVINGNVLKTKWMKAPAPQADAVRIYLNDVFAGIGQTLEDGTVRFRAMLLPEEERHANLDK